MAQGDPWEDIARKLVTPLYYQFAGRTYFAPKFKTVGRLQITGSWLDWLAMLLCKQASAPRLVVLVGGPGSGKSVTAYEIYRRLESRHTGSTATPIYISLAPALASHWYDEDLYLVARGMAELLGGAVIQELDKTAAGPRVFILDNASLTRLEENALMPVCRHLRARPRGDSRKGGSQPKDRVVLLVQNLDILYNLDLPSEDILVLWMDGFANTATVEKNLIAEYRRIEPDEACWPLIRDARRRYEGRLDLENRDRFFASLRGESLRSVRNTEILYDTLFQVGRSLDLFLIPREHSGDPDAEICPYEQLNRAPYPYADLFIWSRDLGWFFANSAVYASLIADAMLMEGWFEPEQERGAPHDRRLLMPVLNRLPTENKTLADMVIAAYIRRLVQELRRPAAPSQIIRVANRGISRVELSPPRLVDPRIVQEEVDEANNKIIDRGYQSAHAEMIDLLRQLRVRAPIISIGNAPEEEDLVLNKAQRERLFEELEAAFVSSGNLDRFVTMHFGVSLSSIATAATVPNQVTDVIKWAQANNRLDNLIREAALEFRGRSKLRELAADLNLELS